MPKFYLRSHDSKLIIDALNTDSAIRKFVKKLIDNRGTFAFLVSISEIGFDSIRDTLLTSLIPYLRNMQYPLPENDELIAMACNTLNEDIDKVDPKKIAWLLGEEFE